MAWRKIMRALTAGAALACASCGVETALIGASLSAAQSGATFYGKSELATFELARFEDVVPAVERTAALLELTKINEKRSPQRVWIYYRYEKNQKLEVTIRRRTDVVTSVDLRVRRPGERAMASLFVHHLARALEEDDAYAEGPAGVSAAGRLGRFPEPAS